MLLNLVINIVIVKYIGRSSRRVRPTHTSESNSDINVHHQPISGRHKYLLRHTIFIFLVFLIGLCPIQLLITIDSDFHVSLLVYRVFVLNIPISLLSITIDLFLLNHAVRIYFKKQMLELKQSIIVRCAIRN